MDEWNTRRRSDFEDAYRGGRCEQGSEEKPEHLPPLETASKPRAALAEPARLVASHTNASPQAPKQGR